MTLIRNYEGDKISRSQAIELIERLKADAPRAEHRDIYGYLGSYEMYSHEQELLTDITTEERVVQSILDKAQSLYIPLIDGEALEEGDSCDKWIASTGISKLEVNAIIHEAIQLAKLYQFENKALRIGTDEILSSSILDKLNRLYAPIISRHYGGE